LANTFLRSILAVVLGFVTLFTVVSAAEFIGHAVFPMPPGIDLKSPESIKANADKLPLGVFVSLLVGWALAAVAGAWVAARLAPAQKLRFGLTIGVIGLLAAIGDMLMIPHPPWVWAVAIVEFLPAAYLGARLAMPRTKES
jgi:hypothetical protein